MTLYEHDRDFSIMIDGQDLMNSRQHESEMDLARLGCAHLTGHKAPCILIGGLGMGYTLRQALDMLSPHAKVVVGELLDAVVEWNRDFLGGLNGQPLADKRVDVQTGDIVELISHSKNRFDAILLDIDNGPSAITDSGNTGDIVELISHSKNRFDAILLDIDNGPSAITDSGNERLYSREGIRACRRALRERGSLAVWSSEENKMFEKILMNCNFNVSRFRVPAYNGSKSSQARFVWVASEDKDILPPGGGAPRLPLNNRSRGSRRRLGR